MRFLADATFADKYPDTLAELARAGVTVRRLDMNARTGGVLHAKYFVVDGEDAFLGSQNFDWRALAHIQEMGVRVRSRAVARALLDVFDADWAFAGGAEGVAAHAPVREVRATTGERLTLVATPRGLLPDERSFALPALVSLLEGARRQVDLQVLSYATVARDGRPFLEVGEYFGPDRRFRDDQPPGAERRSDVIRRARFEAEKAAALAVAGGQ